ncbi:putative carbohydrate esterase [Abeliophyllum distichum]|uniref:Carbohydrate esterase n=1 Tax=Abeliophyllum distichum TaxID=126358 RepID=A0ABD1PB24_9LAMI
MSPLPAHLLVFHHSVFFRLFGGRFPGESTPNKNPQLRGSEIPNQLSNNEEHHRLDTDTLVAGALRCLSSSSPPTPKHTEKTSSKMSLTARATWLAAGAIINGVVPPDNTPDPSKVFRLNALLEWEVARDPLHQDIDLGKPCGVGPGMSFANTVKERLGVIGLVPCAIGGTSISKWEKGGILYENMIKRAKAAVEVGGGGEIKALLWYQGESDTYDLKEALMYKERLERLIDNVRADLNIPSLPILEVIIESSDGPLKDVIIKQQKALKMPNVVQVDSDGLELNKDKIHLNTDAEVKMGKLLADAYLNNFA